MEISLQKSEIWGSQGGEEVDCGLNPEDRGDTFFRNVGNHLQEHKASQPITPQSSVHYKLADSSLVI
jgi:hypothetical protein